MARFLFIFMACMMSSAGEARVFNFKNQTLSTYLRGSLGMNRLQKYAFEPGFPTTTAFDNSGVSQAYSGEFGFGLSTGITTRVGVELLYPQLMKDVEGKNAAGANLMSVTSEVFGVIPQINFEIPFKSGNTWKVYVTAGGGYAIVTIKNTVNMTALGTSTYGVQNYIEEGSGFSIMAQGGFGTEFSFFDNVSLSLDLGYRYLTVNNFTSNRDSTTTRGTLNTGNPITNTDGSKRTTDLGGPWAAIAFRFYIR